MAGALKRQRIVDGAKAEYEAEIRLHRVAIQRNPKDAEVHERLAGAMLNQGLWNEALDELHRAFQIASSNAVYAGHASKSYARGLAGQAIALSREAVRVQPANSAAHYNLGYYLLDSGDPDAAEAEFREALRIEANNPVYLDGLAMANIARGELKVAVGSYQLATNVMKEFSYPYLFAQLRRVERLSALVARVDGMKRDQNVPGDAEGRLELAELCRVIRRFGNSAHFYREAFLLWPASAEDLNSRHRFHAAIAAVRAGTSAGPGKDVLPGDIARAQWRAQALDWLRRTKDL